MNNTPQTIILDGPDQFVFQWDRGQRLRLRDREQGARVDFARYGQDKAISVYAYAENGAVFCDIPDALLTEALVLRVYVYEADGDRGETARCVLLPVIARQKPEDYVEPEDVLTWHELEQRLAELEGDGLARAVTDYLEKHPAQAGATKEEAAQIAQNKQNIEQLNRNKLDAAALPDAVDDALVQAKESGLFNGPKGDPGDDYILTDADRAAIAEMAAELVDVPEGGNGQICRISRTMSAELSIDGHMNAEGKVVNPGKGRCTDFISTADVVRIYGNASFFYSGCLIAFFDADKKILKELAVEGNVIIGNVAYGEGYFEFDISGEEYADAAWFVVSSLRWSDFANNVQTFEDDYCKYVKLVGLDQVDLDDYVTKEELPGAIMAYVDEAILGGAW